MPVQQIRIMPSQITIKIIDHDHITPQFPCSCQQGEIVRADPAPNQGFIQLFALGKGDKLTRP